MSSTEEYSDSEQETKTVNPIVIQLKIDDGLSPYKVYQFFTDFGKILMAAFTPDFAFIQFTDDGRAIEMLQEHDAHRIEFESHNIQIKQADYTHIPYEMYKHVRTSMTYNKFVIQPLVELEVEGPSKGISDALNDHCLCEILGRLSFLDLLNASKTCKKLKQIAVTVFETKFKKTVIRLGDLLQRDGTMTLIQYLLTTFGPSITAIDLKVDITDVQRGTILGLIDKHCKNIKSLSFNGSMMDSNPNTIIDNYADMFGRLETVQIVGGFLGINTFLNACSQLRLLAGMMIDCLDLTRVSLPRLVKIQLAFFKCSGMGEFLNRHPHVEILKMQFPDLVTDSFSGDTQEFIFQHCPNIRAMEIFEISKEKISRLSEMKNLRSVYLSGDMKPLADVMKQLSTLSIETLELESWSIDNNAINSICKMKTITKINFFECKGLDKNILTRLIQNLPNLKRTYVSSSLINIDEILPILKSKRIEWCNSMNRDRFVFYDPRKELILLRNI